MKKIIELLGLPAETKDADVLAAIELLKEQAAAKLNASNKIIKALGLPDDPSEADMVKAIVALKKNAVETVELSEFEKKVQARMTKGRISREAAELAQKHQDIADKEVAARNKKK